MLTFNFLDVVLIKFGMVVTGKNTFSNSKIDYLTFYESLRVPKSSQEFLEFLEVLYKVKNNGNS